MHIYEWNPKPADIHRYIYYKKKICMREQAVKKNMRMFGCYIFYVFHQYGDKILFNSKH